RRRLARAVRPEKAVNLARTDVETDPADGGERTVLFDELLDGDHGGLRSKVCGLRSTVYGHTGTGSAPPPGAPAPARRRDRRPPATPDPAARSKCARPRGPAPDRARSSSAVRS